LPSEAALRLSEELTGPEQRALRAGLPRKATQRLSEDLPKSAFLRSRRTNERRATEVAFRSDPVEKEREVRRTKARPKQDLAKSPAKEATRASLDLGSPGRVGRPDVEAKSEVEETNKKKREGLTKAAEQRNLKRVSKADAIDQRLMLSKRLPATVNELPSRRSCSTRQQFCPPAWLMQAIEEAATSDVPTPLAPPIKFDLSNESVQFNSDLLRANDLDLEQFLPKHQDRNLLPDWRP
jgi:hypothetical protein